MRFARLLLNIYHALKREVTTLLSICCRLLLLPVPHYDRWGLYPQVVFIVGCYAWWYLKETPPGLAIAVLGAAAVIITVRAGHFKKTEQVVWIIIAFVLFFVEARAIYQDRAAHDTATRRESAIQHQEFENILSQNQREFEATRKETKKVFDKTTKIADTATDAVEKITGGDSFVYLTFYTGAQMASVVKAGSAPLYDVGVSVVNCYGSVDGFPSYLAHLGCTILERLGDIKLGNYPIGTSPIVGYWTLNLDDLNALKSAGRVFRPRTEMVFLMATFDARNGTWKEYIWLRHIKADGAAHRRDTWEEALKVYRIKYDKYAIPHKAELLFQQIPKDFPQQIIKDNMRRY